jgi:hypothetical protein
MVSEKSWQEAVTASRGRSALSARELFKMEMAAYSAHDARVRELAKHGGGVVAHDGRNNRMVLSNAIELLVNGNSKGFSEEVVAYAEKAAWDPAYSAISYGLQAVDGFLKNKMLGRTA